MTTVYWFHTKLSPCILQQNCAHADTQQELCSSHTRKEFSAACLSAFEVSKLRTKRTARSHDPEDGRKHFPGTVKSQRGQSTCRKLTKVKFEARRSLDLHGTNQGNFWKRTAQHPSRPSSMTPCRVWQRRVDEKETGMNM